MIKRTILFALSLVMISSITSCEFEFDTDSSKVNTSSSVKSDVESKELERFCPDDNANKFINDYNTITPYDKVTSDDVKCETTAGGYRTTIQLEFITFIYSYADASDFCIVINSYPNSNNWQSFMDEMRIIIKAKYPSISDSEIDNSLSSIDPNTSSTFKIGIIQFSYHSNDYKTEDYNTDFCFQFFPDYYG